MNDEICLFWFRRDLRLDDNTALYFALKENKNVLPIFIFDKEILNNLENIYDARVNFIYDQILRLKKELELSGTTLMIFNDFPVTVFQSLIEKHNISVVYANHDYEPYAIERDTKIKSLLEKNNITFKSFKDQVIFEKNDILKDNGSPYTIFTPYKKKWLDAFSAADLINYDPSQYFNHFIKTQAFKTPALEEIGFKKSAVVIPELSIPIEIIKNYDQTRDYPSLKGTSRIGIHLRFGTVSIRKLVKIANKLNAIYLNELIWREFYMMILWNYPHVVLRSFKSEYDHIEWENKPEFFEAWKNGRTGYPIVDAGMNELNHSGYMHNRLRMITASFLTKHLLIDWRWGESYFASKLLDFELSSNNGGWQWAAGTGCDAAPYFRIFNPHLQTQKFDPKEEYIKLWIPDYHKENYFPPIIDHSIARKRTLEVYSKIKNFR